jgi:REP element-mobilizing transposase RayT
MDTGVIGRHSIRLKGYDYSQPGRYFVTICCQDRICRFGEIIEHEMHINTVGKIVEKCWLEIPQHFPHVILHDYIIMPDHIHGIIEINATSPVTPSVVGANNYSPLPPPPPPPHGTSKTVGSIIRGFKIGVTKQIGKSIWQRNYYDHIIRDDESFVAIANYVRNNSRHH